MYGPNLVHDLPPFDEQRNLRVVVETPRGANIKIKFDEKLGFFCLSRVLPLGVTYPYDFGFVPQTLAQDGDPIDAVVLIDAMTYPGVVISCRLLGALQVEERGLRGRPNHRLVAVPVKAARREEWRNFSDLGKRMQQELERFFVMSSAFTSKDPVVRGWVGPDAANDMVQRSISRYRERTPSRPMPQSLRSELASAISHPAAAEAAASTVVVATVSTTVIEAVVSGPIAAPSQTAPEKEPDKAESA